jgi:hypothetical protein
MGHLGQRSDLDGSTTLEAARIWELEIIRSGQLGQHHGFEVPPTCALRVLNPSIGVFGLRRGVR